MLPTNIIRYVSDGMLQLWQPSNKIFLGNYAFCTTRFYLRQKTDSRFISKLTKYCRRCGYDYHIDKTLRYAWREIGDEHYLIVPYILIGLSYALIKELEYIQNFSENIYLEDEEQILRIQEIKNNKASLIYIPEESDVKNEVFKFKFIRKERTVC